MSTPTAARPVPDPRRPTLTDTDPPIPPTDPTPRLHLPHPPRLRVDLPAVAARYRAILTTTSTAEMRAALIASVADIPALVAEVDRLWALLTRTRLRYANLAAAARATLAAYRDGEPDPLGYLRDELHHPGPGDPVPGEPGEGGR